MLSWKEESPSVWVIHDGVLLHSVSYLHLFWETIPARSPASLRVYISPLQPRSLVILHAFGLLTQIGLPVALPFSLSKALCEGSPRPAACSLCFLLYIILRQFKLIS